MGSWGGGGEMLLSDPSPPPSVDDLPFLLTPED